MAVTVDTGEGVNKPATPQDAADARESPRNSSFDLQQQLVTLNNTPAPELFRAHLPTEIESGNVQDHVFLFRLPVKFADKKKIVKAWGFPLFFCIVNVFF